MSKIKDPLNNKDREFYNKVLKKELKSLSTKDLDRFVLLHKRVFDALLDSLVEQVEQAQQ